MFIMAEMNEIEAVDTLLYTEKQRLGSDDPPSIPFAQNGPI